MPALFPSRNVVRVHALPRSLLEGPTQPFCGWTGTIISLHFLRTAWCRNGFSLRTPVLAVHGDKGP